MIKDMPHTMPPAMIASLGPDVPHALLSATGRYAGLLPWDIDRPFPHAAQWLESKFPLWAFSVVEDWASGAFDHLETVVFSRGDDAAQRLYYYLCELQRRGLVGGPEPVILDVARIPRPGGEQRCTDAVTELAARLAVEPEAVARAIEQANAALPAAPSCAGKRACLLAGTLPPDNRLHHMIEHAGWHPVGQTMGDAWGCQQSAVERHSDGPFAALGRQIHQSRTGARSFHDRRAALTQRVADTAAKAAILWYAEEDEAEVWNLPAQRDALAQAGVPTLILTRRSWRADDGVAGEIAQFLQEFDR